MGYYCVTGHHSDMMNGNGNSSGTERYRIEERICVDMRQMRERIWKDIKEYGPVVGILFTLWLVLTLLFGSACITVFITGLPCPGCGMGHALLSFLTGNIAQANSYNPSLWIWLIFGLGFFLHKYVLGKETRHLGWILTVVALLTVAIYLYRMIKLFPSEPPLTYYEDNLIQKVFPEYGNLILGLFD